MIPRERELTEQLVKTYPQLSKASPCSWFVFTDDLAKAEHHWTAICHAQMQYHKPGCYDQIITSIPMSEPLDLSYITFLIDGPFRAFRDRISLESIEVDGEQKYYVRCTKLDTWPSNVIYNFCIATRVPVEYPYMLPFWDKLSAAGVDETLAWLIACRISYGGNVYDVDGLKLPEGDPWGWKLHQIHCPSGHFWIDPTSAWKPILFGEPLVKQFSENYKKNPRSCRPTNKIWGSIKQTEGQALIGKTVKELSDFFGFTKVGEKSTIQHMVDSFAQAVPDDEEDDLLVDLADDDDVDDDDDPDWDDDIDDDF
jgi:hypothetical protein